MNKFATKIASLAAAATVGISSTLNVFAQDSFETAWEASETINVGINLGNSLDANGEWIDLYTDAKPADFEKAWGNPVTTKAIITMFKNAGFNTVRVPVTWAQHIDDSGNIDKEWLDRVQEVVDYVISQDLYCILNVHHDGGENGWLEASEECFTKNAAKFSGLWTNIAQRFRDYDEKLIFESYNEILDENNTWTETDLKEAYKASNDFNQLFVDSVRATGGNNEQRNLMLQTYSGANSEKTLANFVLPEDSIEGHLMVQVHTYDPQAFTFDDATWTTMTDKWGSAEDKQYQDEFFKRLDRYAKQLNAPFIIGEFAANDKNNTVAREAFAAYMVKTGAKYNVKCIWWETGGMALFDRENCKEKFPTIIDALVDNSVGKHSPDSMLRGDADENGVVNALDASKILMSVVGLATVGAAADFNADGIVNALDAAAILNFIVSNIQ